MSLKFDTIGYWTELKLEIIEKYAKAYSAIMSSKKFHHVYIDAFAGAGTHISKATGEHVRGSPQIVLDIQPPFEEYYFIDIDSDKVDELNRIAMGRSEVKIFHGDCNNILLKEIFPKVSYKDYRRGLCLLDPYGLHLDWKVIETAGHMETIDMFLNFPVADMNRNVLWRDSQGVDPADIARMNAYWGDDSWMKIAYGKPNLFNEPWKEDNEVIAAAFQKRLHEMAGFKYVADPLTMKNSRDAIIYYLFFASQQKLAGDIHGDIIAKIFNPYRQ
jgi:three-Cys-motif partner protein